MATRSRIAIENQDRTVTSIYCHFDGYISGNGEILQTLYTNRKKVEKLIALGDISVLGDDPEHTTAYHRDRSEDFNQNTHNNVEDFFDEAFGAGEEYAYLFTLDNRWLVCNGGPIAELQLALKGEDVI
jgi:hypothetical protein